MKRVKSKNTTPAKRSTTTNYDSLIFILKRFSNLEPKAIIALSIIIKYKLKEIK